MKTQIFPQVHAVLDIHSGGNEAIYPLCSSFHPIPDPQQRAEIAQVARLFDTPFIMLYSSQLHSGLLTDEAEAMGKITIGGEFGYAESTNRKGTLHAYEGIKNVLRHYGLLPGDIVKIDPARPSPPRFVQAVNLADYIPCPKDGVWEPLVDLGVDVSEGALAGAFTRFLRSFVRCAGDPSPPLRCCLHASLRSANQERIHALRGVRGSSAVR